jgi:hypothetical protein
MRFVALKPRPRLLTLEGLLLHGYIADQETLDYIKDMIEEARETTPPPSNPPQ